MKRTLLILSLLIVVTGCSSLREFGNNRLTRGINLSSKIKVTIPVSGTNISVNGVARMVGGEMIQVSVLMPILRTELARPELTPKGIVLVNRMDKQFAKYDYDEINRNFGVKTSYSKIESAIIAAAVTAGGSKLLSGKDIGLPKDKGTKIEFYDISFNGIKLNPFEPTNRYREIGIEEIENVLNLLK